MFFYCVNSEFGYLKKTRWKTFDINAKLISYSPRTSALAHPYVFLSQGLGAILTERNAMVRAAMSDSMWNESEMRAMELVTCPTVISTMKKVVVRLNMVSRRHCFPLKRFLAAVELILAFVLNRAQFFVSQGFIVLQGEDVL